MFYSTELLSIRRRGKLARCWLAATASEKMFKKYCRPNLLQKIDIYNTCEEILLTVQVQNGRSYSRFSLYLSAQLMYGITRILSYQTKLFQDYLFDTYMKLITDRSAQKKFNLTRNINVRDEPRLDEVFRNRGTPPDLNLIRDESYRFVVEEMILDEMNFGVLPNHEMEEFLFLGGEEQSLGQIRRLPWDITEETIRELEVELPSIKTDKIETEEEIRLASARRDQEQLSTVARDDQLSKVPAISRKRSALSTEEIPSKRRKTSPAEETMPPEPEQMPLPDAINVAIDPVPVIESRQEEVQQPLQDEQLIVVEKPKRKRKIYDKYTKLSDDVMRSNIQNVTAHTTKFSVFRVTLLPAKEHLKQPSTIIFNRSWGKSLTKLFKQHTVGPFVVENEFQITDMEIEETMGAESIRANTSSKLRDQTGEISSKLAPTIIETTDQMLEKTLLIGTTDQSKVLDKTFPTIGQPKVIEENQQTERTELEESTVELPQISDIEEKIREAQEKSRRSTDVEKSKSESSSFRSEIQLSKQELLAFMEVQWRERRLINFHDLFSPENYTKKEVARGFFLCLEFQKEKIVILKQADPFDVIWIEKYPCYS